MTNDDDIDVQVKQFYLEPKVFLRDLLLTIRDLERRIYDLEDDVRIVETIVINGPDS